LNDSFKGAIIFPGFYLCS